MSEVWVIVTETLDTLLLSSMKPSDRKPEELVEDEEIDVKVIMFLRTKVLDQLSLFPHSFILSIKVLLRQYSFKLHRSGPQQEPGVGDGHFNEGEFRKNLH